MEVVLAKTAGFCFGVSRAVEQVYEQLEKNQGVPIYTFGPIVHNEEVVEDLKSKGVQVINTEEELAAVEEGIVIIRAHGVAKRIYDLLERNGVTVVDATCPFVKKIHKKVQESSRAGREIIIAGNPVHPEVQGIIGWCETPVTVIEQPEDVERYQWDPNKEYCLVAQTTYHYQKFINIIEILKKVLYNIICENTICNATHERQAEAAQIASTVDAMIVIGGRNSSNTQKLYEICRGKCKDTYYIQTVDGLDTGWLTSMKKVGITAGASTPRNIIQEVVTVCQR
ncbi:MAG: 4-hydroxy-3-methylbut-2-enyl diphosphate reductase [Lachnospiraceae bacterium]|nr:4-hydroxy-3-methylbut-2-enyl diphosphate reductase [Lachnospiraceae bacterium]